jgi:energy-coupling factor transport system substrate-specific component
MSGIGSVAGFTEHVKREFTTQTWALIPMGVALSVVAAYVVNAVKVPFLYLDALGVVLIAVLAGPWAAALTGLFVNVVEGFVVNPIYWAYTPLQVGFGLAAGYMARRGWFRRFWKVVVVGLVVAALSIVAGAPITVVAFGGVTGTGSDAVTTFFRATGLNIWEAVFSQTIVVEPIDKVLTVVLAALIVRQIPERYRPDTASTVLDRGL